MKTREQEHPEALDQNQSEADFIRSFCKFCQFCLETPSELKIVRQRWKHMGDLMETHSDGSPVCVPIKEVFDLPEINKTPYHSMSGIYTEEDFFLCKGLDNRKKTGCPVPQNALLRCMK